MTTVPVLTVLVEVVPVVDLPPFEVQAELKTVLGTTGSGDGTREVVGTGVGEPEGLGAGAGSEVDFANSPQLVERLVAEVVEVFVEGVLLTGGKRANVMGAGARKLVSGEVLRGDGACNGIPVLVLVLSFFVSNLSVMTFPTMRC